MSEQTITWQSLSQNSVSIDPAISQLRKDYSEVQARFQAQSPNIQRFLEAQAMRIGEALLKNLPEVSFSLPENVKTAPDSYLESIPHEIRQQKVGTRTKRHLAHKDLHIALRQTFQELEQSNIYGVAISGALLRYTTAKAMVHNFLPAGHKVTYTTAEGDTIPSIPLPVASKSAIHAASDGIIESTLPEGERSELQVPYVEYARCFYLPQWVAFDEKCRLLVSSLNEAEAYIASLQRYLYLLHTGVGLAPYMVADDDYQQKRYGILGQLVNQGRALARYQVQEMINTIQQRAKKHNLNRGLHLSIPYFDDQKLTIENYEVDVIPAGRIMFIPAFVVRAAHEQQVKVAQDTRLSPSTRRHLLILFYLLGSAFYAPKVGSFYYSKG